MFTITLTAATLESISLQQLLGKGEIEGKTMM